MKIKFEISVLLLVMFYFVIISCQNSLDTDEHSGNDKDTNNVSSLKIFSFTPEEAYPNDTVRINGQGFGFSKDSILILINNIEQQVTFINDQNIHFVLSESFNENSFIKIIKGHDTVLTKNMLKIKIANKLQFYSIIPNHTCTGENVEISGQGFYYGPNPPIVRIGNQNANIISWSDSTIFVTVPDASLGFDDINISTTRDSVKCQNCLIMTKSIYYFTKAIVTLTNISGTMVTHSRTGTPGNYEYKDSSYISNGNQINISVNGDYRGWEQIMPTPLSFFDKDKIYIASGLYENQNLNRTYIYYSSFIIDSLNKQLNSFEASNSESVYTNSSSDEKKYKLSFDKIPYTMLSNGDIQISIQGKLIENYFVSHEYSIANGSKSSGTSYNLKDIAITDSSILTITIFH